MLRAVRAVLMTVVLVTPAVAVAQNYAMPSASRYFRVESETGNGRRGPILSGYVYNDHGGQSPIFRGTADSVASCVVSRLGRDVRRDRTGWRLVQTEGPRRGARRCAPLDLANCPLIVSRTVTAML